MTMVGFDTKSTDYESKTNKQKIVVLHQTKTLLPRKENNQQNKKTIHGMGEKFANMYLIKDIYISKYPNMRLIV